MPVSESDHLFGNKAVELEFITQKQLDRVLQLKEKSMPNKKLGEILMAKGFISNKEVKTILKYLGEEDGLQISRFDTYFWSLKIRCTCNKKILFPGNLIGSKGMCPQCLQKMIIPEYNNSDILGFACPCGTKLPKDATHCTKCNGVRPDLKHGKLTNSKSKGGVPPKSLKPLTPQVITPEPPKSLKPLTPEVITPDPNIHTRPQTPQVVTPEPLISPTVVANKEEMAAIIEKHQTGTQLTPLDEALTSDALTPLSQKKEEATSHLETKVLGAISSTGKSGGLQAVDVSEQAADRQFARICFRMGLATQNQIDEALSQQEKSLTESNDYLKLGQILIRNGVISVQDFLKIVAEQKKNLLECENCHAIYKLKNFKPNSMLSCRNCGTEIQIPATIAPTQGTQTAHAELGTVTPGTASGLRSSESAELKSLGFKETGLIGQKLGKYEIIGELGRGGMGVVFKARDTDLNRLVAMKILRDGDGATEEQIRRFQKEAESMGKIRHQLIVPIYDYGQQEDLHYFTMEYIEGRTLDEFVDRRSFTQAKAVKILYELADAIHAAHSVGVIHRDLKPSNIIVDVEGLPHIMDFGLAKDVDLKAKLTRTGAQVGTPYYMSPEQARGEKKITPLVDVYALGVILYEMLTGRVPFTGQNQAEVYRKIINRTPRPIRELNPKVSPDLEVIAARLMMKYSEDRYPTAKDLAEDLERFMEHMPIQAKRDNLVTKGLRFLRHNGKQVGAAFFALSVFVLLLYYLFYVFILKNVKQDTNRKLSELKKKLQEQIKEDDKPDQAEKQKERLREIRKNIDDIIARLRMLSTKPDKELQFRLVQLNDEEEIDYLANYLKDPEIRIRELVASTFIRVGKKRAAPYILEALKKAREPGEISVYLTALGKLEHQAAIPEIFKLIDHHKKQVRDIAISSISMLEADPQYLPVLIDKLQNSREVRIRSLVLMIMMKTYRFPEVYEPVQACLNDPSPLIQEMAIQAVGRLKIKSSVAKLGKMVRFNPNPNVRIHAIKAMAKIGDRRSGEILKATIRDDNLFVAKAAAKALQALTLGETGYSSYKRIEKDIDEKVALIDNYVAQAKGLRNRRQYESAIACINKALKISPFYDGYLQRGIIYFRMGRVENALKDYTEAQRFDPFGLEAMFAKGELLARTGKPNHAVQELSRALEINPQSQQGLKLRATIYQDMGENDKAIEDLKELLVFADNEAEAYTFLAGAYAIQRDNDKALENYSLAIKTDPSFTRAYEDRALFYMQLKDYDKALEDLDKALEVDPRSARALSCRGELHRRKKQFSDSLADFTRALSIDPKDVDSAMMIGEILEVQGKTRDALKYYTQAIEVKRSEPIFYVKRGAALIEIKEYQEAVLDYKEAFRLKPTMTQPHHGLIYCYIELKKFKKAWEHVRKAEEYGVHIPRNLTDRLRRMEKK